MRPVLLLMAALLVCGFAHSQSLEPSDSTGQGMRAMPPKPGGGPDPYAQFKTDPLSRRALREQARLNARLRRKQVLEATELLLKITRDLRAEMAANPNAIPTSSETERLHQIQKLARLIQDREKSEDQATESLARGTSP